MAEQLTSTEPTTVAAAPDAAAIKAEIDRQMAISLNNGMEPQAAAAAPAADPSAPATEPAAAPPPSDPFGLLKEKFGYESPEAALQEIEALRAFRASPPPAQVAYENEQSRQIAEALQAGNFKEVHDILNQQLQIDQLTAGEMTPEVAANVIKLGMQLKYKDLKPEEINYKFNKTYGLPPKPGMLPAEDQEEYEERVRAWEAQVADKQMELMIDAKLARPDLAGAKAKLVIPTITKPQDNDYLEWQKTVQENDRLAAETTQAYKAFTPTSLATKLNFKDEPNKIDFDFTDEPDPSSFKQTQDLVSDINDFWQHFIHPDGTPNREGFMRFVYRGLNFEKMVTNAMNQAKNATIKALLPDNSQGGIVREMPRVPEENYVDTMMRQSLKGYGGF